MTFLRPVDQHRAKTLLLIRLRNCCRLGFGFLDLGRLQDLADFASRNEDATMFGDGRNGTIVDLAIPPALALPEKLRELLGRVCDTFHCIWKLRPNMAGVEAYHNGPD